MIHSEDCSMGTKVKLNKYHGNYAYRELVEVGDIGTIHKFWTHDCVLVRFPRALMGICVDDLDLIKGEE